MIFTMAVGFSQKGIGKYNSFNAGQTESMDWIFYFANAYHKTWKAFTPETDLYTLELRHESGVDTLVDGKYYWTNLNAPLDSKIIYGPSVWQSFPHRISYNLGFLEDNTPSSEFAVNRASAKKLLGIEFEVVNKTTSEFYAVESLEVSDPFIWGNYFTPAGEVRGRI